MSCPTCSFELAKLSPWGMLQQETAQRLAALASRFHTVIKENGRGQRVEPPHAPKIHKIRAKERTVRDGEDN